MKLRKTMCLGILGGAALAYVAWVAWCAHMDWVTLNVRNMDVRRVVKKIEKQTWETILVHSNVHGNVTLNVRRAALDDVLRLIAQQTSARSEKMYPLYGKNRSLDMLKRSLAGELNPADHGWTNLQSRGFFRGGPGGMFGGGPMGMANESAPQKISLQIVNKELSFATLALNRFAQVRVVPEDGAFPMVSLNLYDATPQKAVKELAKKVDRSWTKLYALTREGGPGGRGGGPEFAMRGRRENTNDEGRQALTNEPPRRGFDMTTEQREEFRTKQNALEAELVSVLPAQEQMKLQQTKEEREKQFQEMQNMTPEERRTRFAQMGGGNMDRMNRDRLKNSTQEQRVEQTRRMQQMRTRMQQAQQAPTPTGR